MSTVFTSQAGGDSARFPPGTFIPALSGEPSNTFEDNRDNPQSSIELTSAEKKITQSELPLHDPLPKFDPSSYFPDFVEGTDTDGRFAGLGTNFGRTFDVLVTPTFKAEGLNTANVDPVDVASSLNASAMMSESSSDLTIIRPGPVVHTPLSVVNISESDLQTRISNFVRFNEGGFSVKDGVHANILVDSSRIPSEYNNVGRHAIASLSITTGDHKLSSQVVISTALFEQRSRIEYPVSLGGGPRAVPQDVRPLDFGFQSDEGLSIHLVAESLKLAKLLDAGEVHTFSGRITPNTGNNILTFQNAWLNGGGHQLGLSFDDQYEVTEEALRQTPIGGAVSEQFPNLLSFEFHRKSGLAMNDNGDKISLPSGIDFTFSR